jgi:transposase-like protein
MPKTVARVFDREFKLAAVRRMLAGENVSALARELRIRRKYLYQWRDRFRSGGPGALRSKGRPRKSEALIEAAASEAVAAPALRRGASARPSADELSAARRRIEALERKIGQQQVELDFFRQALRRIREARRLLDGSGVPASTRSSRR